MKRFIILVLCMVVLILPGCTIKMDDLEDATIYTTTAPINYLTKLLYSDYAEIKSIYPSGNDTISYNFTEKQLNKYAKGDLFIYNGLTDEKNIAKTLLNKNGRLLIIDVCNGVTLKTGKQEELWLSPNNFLMLSKNIRNNLEEYLTSKFIIDDIETKYIEFEEKISIMDATLHNIGKNSKNVIIASNDSFYYLEDYGFEVISLSDEANLKELKLKTIKNNFKVKKYTKILTATEDKENELIQELVKDYSASIVEVDTMSDEMNDYFDTMTKYIENIREIAA